MTLKKITVLALISSLVLSLFVEDAEARRRRRRRPKQPKVINEKKLYERMGGRDVLTKTVDDWMRLSLADGELAVKLKPLADKPTEMAKARKLLADELCEIADGPCPEMESEWIALRTKYNLDEPATIAFASFLSEALMARGVGERERNELLGRLGAADPLSMADAAGPASERRGGAR